ncbi:MAG: glycosyltransferase family 2 protein [Bacteroidetes bacterium]|nr:glycosyltransferase family 2 protein [Bacteroidota bacterium]
MSEYSTEIKFSVVIPTYNAAGTIVRTIESCLKQSYAAHEIIVVDDGSTDETEQLLEERFGNKIIYTRLYKNLGPSFARNKGMDLATGNYIAFLDADDGWHEDKLLVAKSILEANTKIKFLYHPFTQEDVSTKKLPEGATIYTLPFIKLLNGNVIGTPCVVLANDKSFRFETEMRYMEDYDLWLRIGYRNKIYFINLSLTQIGRPVLSKGGQSGNKWKMRKGELKAYTRLARLNPLFILLLPVLYVYSLSKHIYKAITGK